MLQFLVYKGECSVGTAQMEKQGLYYRITCRISALEPQPCRVLGNSNMGRFDCGLCVREGDSLVATKRVLHKAVDTESLRFFLDEKSEEARLPVVPGMPFEQLQLLPGARLSREGECYYISSSSSTGQ